VIQFRAQELHEDGAFREAAYAFEGSTEEGWTVLREGKRWLELPTGYELLETVCCGICYTDLSRRFLPFALPQIIGHEALARDSRGRLVAVEINASCTALGLPEEKRCSLCRRGQPTHCIERLTLGIDRLPGGFGPYMLAPRGCIVPLPDELPAEAAVLIEPFAAALHAVETIDLDSAETVAVLGAGRLGLLVVAALRAVRERSDRSFTIAVCEKNPRRAALARDLGADATWAAPPDGAVADVVIEATGSADGLDRALTMARREVHVKSTTGREALGLNHLTEMVVDEITLAPLELGRPAPAAIGTARTALVIGRELARRAGSVLEQQGLTIVNRRTWEIEKTDPGNWTRFDVVVVPTLEMADRAIRPRPGSSRGLVRPRGTILIDRTGSTAPLVARLFDRHLRITASRCGDFGRALGLLEELHRTGARLGERLISHCLPVSDLKGAMKTASQPDASPEESDFPRTFQYEPDLKSFDSK